ncbi:MAG: purine-nucleoside phosphorylase [Erysipelotrichia bacterium]|nr:purine-nucleoside phosphorylase [Erysipelotrichia bacterium]NCC55502.1 purine-nucleoside phosphorylase [Erysipelotrichia bacterium]
MSTPHNEANKGEIASVVLMPGDPLRAKFIADTYLQDVVCFNKVRNMFGYTGTYKGKRVSVMGSGMGMPSIGIYSYELFSQYDVSCIIRVGSAGSYCHQAKVYDVILVSEAYSESNYARVQNGYQKDKTYPDASLNVSLHASAKRLQIPIIEGCIHSSDVFYQEDKSNYYQRLYEEHGCLAVEMESFALFHNAKVLGKKAACLLTISDSFVSNEITSAKERETSFTKMIEIALESII